MRLHLAAALLAGAALLPAGAALPLAGAAAARTLRLPEGKPAVMFEVPDDWTVTPADGGFQLVSPDHTSIILAGMAKADRAGLAAWQKAAGQRMIDFGIAFDSKANAPKAGAALAGAAGAPGAGSSAIAPLADLEAPPKVKAGELAPLSTVPSMALLGRPSDLSAAALEADDAAGKSKADAPGDGTPAAATAAAAKPEADKPAPDKPAPDKTATDKPKPDKPAAGKPAADGAAPAKAAEDKDGKPLHFASVVIRGASLAGKPVDVQFLNFGYSKSEWFLMQQESGPEDGRAGAVVKSVRAIR